MDKYLCMTSMVKIPGLERKRKFLRWPILSLIQKSVLGLVVPVDLTLHSPVEMQKLSSVKLVINQKNVLKCSPSSVMLINNAPKCPWGRA